MGLLIILVVGALVGLVAGMIMRSGGDQVSDRGYTRGGGILRSSGRRLR